MTKQVTNLKCKLRYPICRSTNDKIETKVDTDIWNDDVFIGTELLVDNTIYSSIIIPIYMELINKYRR